MKDFLIIQWIISSLIITPGLTVHTEDMRNISSAPPEPLNLVPVDLVIKTAPDDQSSRPRTDLVVHEIRPIPVDKLGVHENSLTAPDPQNDVSENKPLSTDVRQSHGHVHSADVPTPSGSSVTTDLHAVRGDIAHVEAVHRDSPGGNVDFHMGHEKNIPVIHPDRPLHAGPRVHVDMPGDHNNSANVPILHIEAPGHGLSNPHANTDHGIHKTIPGGRRNHPGRRPRVDVDKPGVHNNTARVPLIHTETPVQNIHRNTHLQEEASSTRTGSSDTHIIFPVGRTRHPGGGPLVHEEKLVNGNAASVPTLHREAPVRDVSNPLVHTDLSMNTETTKAAREGSFSASVGHQNIQGIRPMPSLSNVWNQDLSTSWTHADTLAQPNNADAPIFNTGSGRRHADITGDHVITAKPLTTRLQFSVSFIDSPGSREIMLDAPGITGIRTPPHKTQLFGSDLTGSHIDVHGDITGHSTGSGISGLNTDKIKPLSNQPKYIGPERGPFELNARPADLTSDHARRPLVQTKSFDAFSPRDTLAAVQSAGVVDSSQVQMSSIFPGFPVVVAQDFKSVLSPRRSFRRRTGGASLTSEVRRLASSLARDSLGRINQGGGPWSQSGRASNRGNRMSRRMRNRRGRNRRRNRRLG